jgi:hypothetical protein
MTALRKPAVEREEAPWTCVVPGAYDGVPAERYHAVDVTEAPALSSSGARLILDECPALYRYEYLDPKEQIDKEYFDVGTAGHLIVLEPDTFDARVQVIDAPDWKTKAAREERDTIRAAGQVPLLTKQHADVMAMRNAIFAHPIARHAFTDGVSERSFFWKDPETGVWLKSRPDFTPNHSRYLTDYKTAASANPDVFARSIWNYGYYQQAAWLMDAYQAVTGETPQDFYFVVQMKAAPYLVTVVKADEEDVQFGRLQNRRAIRIFADCLNKGVWPGYRDLRATTDTAIKVKMPGYAIRELEMLADLGAFESPKAAAPDHHELTPLDAT